LALTSDLFDVLLPLLCGTNLTFCKTFWEKLLLALRDKTAKSTQSSEATIQRNSLRGPNPEWLASPNFLERQVAFSLMRQFKRTAQMRGLLQIQMESIMLDLYK
jgi:hypothetical protein